MMIKDYKALIEFDRIRTYPYVTNILKVYKS